MSEKKKEISASNLVMFLATALKHCKVEVSIESAFELSELIYECFDDNQMFDSWFLGMDVMN